MVVWNVQSRAVKAHPVREAGAKCTMPAGAEQAIPPSRSPWGPNHTTPSGARLTDATNHHHPGDGVACTTCAGVELATRSLHDRKDDNAPLLLRSGNAKSAAQTSRLRRHHHDDQELEDTVPPFAQTELISQDDEGAALSIRTGRGATSTSMDTALSTSTANSPLSTDMSCRKHSDVTLNRTRQFITRTETVSTIAPRTSNYGRGGIRKGRGTLTVRLARVSITTSPRKGAFSWI